MTTKEELRKEYKEARDAEITQSLIEFRVEEIFADLNAEKEISKPQE